MPTRPAATPMATFFGRPKMVSICQGWREMEEREKRAVKSRGEQCASDKGPQTRLNAPSQRQQPPLPMGPPRALTAAPPPLF